MSQRKMRIGMSIRGVGYHPAAWRHPDVPADGTLPGGCEDFVDMVIPELQRRGLFRTEYEGKTPRENLGLRPAINRNAPGAERRAAE
jgi:hypothetical protein